MTKVQRFDIAGRLGKTKRTPQGGIEVSATLTRVGILTYRNPDGSERREYRPPEEVFSAQSLETLKHAPVSNLHPFGPEGQELITPGNFRDFSVGHLSGDPRQDGDFVAGDLIVQDHNTISLVEKGERNEVSCGYVCSYDPTPGKTPGGERYDGIQRNIVYNHVALVPRGRAGREVALRLDSDGNQLGPDRAEKTYMKIEIIEGTEYEVGTPAHTKAKAEAAQARADAEDSLKTALAERDQFKAELDRTKAEYANRFDDAVKERVDLIKLAERKGAKIEGSNQEIRASILTKLSPSLKFDSGDDVYVKAALDVAMSQGNLAEAAKAAISQESPKEARADGREPMAADDHARENMIRRLNGRPEVDLYGLPLNK